jgi:hypothetical protein
MIKIWRGACCFELGSFFGVKCALLLTICGVLAGTSAQAQGGPYMIPAGTQIVLLTDNRIDARATTGRVFPAQILDPIADAAGQVLVPAGTMAQLTVTGGPDGVELALSSVTINGRLFPAVGSPPEDGAAGAGLGRPPEFTGGGAPLGTLMGATIRRLAEPDIGGTPPIQTRGSAVRVPNGTVLTFRLDRPMWLRPWPA